MVGQVLLKTALIAQSLYDDFREFLSPSKCLSCGRDRDFPDPILCPECLGNLTSRNRGAGPICPICASAAKSPASNRTCIDHLELYYWGFYERELQACLLQFKFHNSIDMGKRLALMAGETTRNMLSANHYDFIIPVPLHKTREKQRSFNQSEIIAGEIGRRLSIPVDIEVLTRVRPTEQQAKLPERERWNNVRDAFVVSNEASKSICGRRILLVDDIVTTGATIYEASLPILAHKPERLDNFSLAYAK